MPPAAGGSSSHCDCQSVSRRRDDLNAGRQFGKDHAMIQASAFTMGIGDSVVDTDQGAVGNRRLTSPFLVGRLKVFSSRANTTSRGDWRPNHSQTKDILTMAKGQ